MRRNDAETPRQPAVPPATGAAPDITETPAVQACETVADSVVDVVAVPVSHDGGARMVRAADAALDDACPGSRGLSPRRSADGPAPREALLGLFDADRLGQAATDCQVTPEKIVLRMAEILDEARKPADVIAAARFLYGLARQSAELHGLIRAIEQSGEVTQGDARLRVTRKTLRLSQEAAEECERLLEKPPTPTMLRVADEPESSQVAPPPLHPPRPPDDPEGDLEDDLDAED